MNFEPSNMNIILFDDDIRDQLLPLTFTRPVGNLRVGILTIKEKWEKWMDAEVSYISQDYLAGKYPIEIAEDNIIVNASVLPSARICAIIRQLKNNEALLRDDELIAARLNEEQFKNLINDEAIEQLQGLEIEDDVYSKINHLWDIFLLNHQEIVSDFKLLTQYKTSAPIPSTNQVINPENVFLEEGAKVHCAVLNASNGPIYIGKNAEVMEGSLVRGAFALCDNATLKLGAKIYGPTTIGPHSKVGGEVKNSVIISNSNKAHDGYLGNAVIGEFCNIGAGSCNSNLKNTYGEVMVWNYPANDFEPSGQQFCGLIMGDHSKCGINTMFNTGTVIGVAANVFGTGFPPKFVPSFSWGGADGLVVHKKEKAFETAERVMKRKKLKFGVEERIIMIRVFEETEKYRN